MQIFTNTKLDFLGKRMHAALFSTALLVAGLFAIFSQGFNMGIDFKGGTEVELKFLDDPDVPALRATMDALGVGQVSLQQVGQPGDNTILIRVQEADGGAAGSTVSQRIVEALYNPQEHAALAAGRTNLNRAGAEDIGLLLEGCPGAAGSPQEGRELATEIAALRVQEQGVLASYDQLDGLPGMTPEARSCLEENTFLPGFAKWKDYFVGPKVGAELRTKAILAIAVSLVFILGYITWRFQFEYGVGAVLALFHDVVVTTGLLVLLGQEFTLTTVAALLTLAGYSINDTIVVFDRIRENTKAMRTAPFETVINKAINQTLSRTVLTAATTLLVVASLYFFGGSELRGFSIAMFLGVIIGTYSSIFIASPAVLLWRKYSPRMRGRRAARV